jgi:prophage regulatory protein
MSKNILRMPAVIKKTGLSRTAIYNRIINGSFPKQIVLGPRAVGFLECEIDEWIDRCVDRSRPPQTAGEANDARRAATFSK